LQSTDDDVVVGGVVGVVVGVVVVVVDVDVVGAAVVVVDVVGALVVVEVDVVGCWVVPGVGGQGQLSKSGVTGPLTQPPQLSILSQPRRR